MPSDDPDGPPLGKGGGGEKVRYDPEESALVNAAMAGDDAGDLLLASYQKYNELEHAVRPAEPSS